MPRPLAVLVLALALATGAQAAEPGPSGVRAFLLRATEAERPTHVFARTPSFAWDPVPGADRYEFELATSKTFAENAIVWSDSEIGGPLATVPITLPWISGARYSWRARVRAIVDGEETAWSTPYGFNVRAPGAPRSLSNGVNPQPGMVRWTPIEGATAYEVVFLWELGQGKTKRIRTATTAADLREVYAFHNGIDWANVTFWRARAVREVYGSPKNRLPVVSYGPWSPRNRTVEPALSTGAITLAGAISRSRRGDVVNRTTSGAPGPGPHELSPGFWWSGVYGPAPELLGACPLDLVAALSPSRISCPLFRVYVFSDADCVNAVHVGDLVGSPAYVPRLTPTLGLPGDLTTMQSALGVWLTDGSEGTVYDAGGTKVVATGVKTKEESAGPDGETPEGATAEEGASGSEEEVDRRNGLWDNDWPTGRYYWTAVPTVPRLAGDAIEYREVAFAQDMCASGQVIPFGKTSRPITIDESGIPFVSGLTPGGETTSAMTVRPSFYGSVLAAWKPAPGAKRYEIQWSARLYPWRAAGKLITAASAALLDLPAGRWLYRVRGLDETLPGPSGLSWSEPVQIQIVPRSFDVVSEQRR